MVMVITDPNCEEQWNYEISKFARHQREDQPLTTTRHYQAVSLHHVDQPLLMYGARYILLARLSMSNYRSRKDENLPMSKSQK